MGLEGAWEKCRVDEESHDLIYWVSMPDRVH